MARPSSARPALRGIIYEVTSRCNLNCLYCYNIHKAPLGIPPATGGYRKAKRTLKRLFKVADVERVTMTGGEPLLQERFLELVLFCRMKGKRVAVISNGNRGAKEDYRHLIGMGVTLYELPLHSTVPEEHDEMTGVPGSHATVLESIGTIRRLGGVVVPMIVITKINRRRVVDTLRLFKRLGLRRIMLNRFNIGGAGIGNARRLSLSIEALREVFAEADEATRALGLKVSSNVCSPRCVLDGRAFPSISFTRCSPRVERRPLTMDLDGNLRFCNHSPIVMGNIFTDDIRDVVSSDYALSWKERPDFCSGCDEWAACFGGCRAASEQLGQTVRQVDPVLQHLERPPFTGERRAPRILKKLG